VPDRNRRFLESFVHGAILGGRRGGANSQRNIKEIRKKRKMREKILDRLRSYLYESGHASIVGSKLDRAVSFV
jgi:hypothetical protein